MKLDFFDILLILLLLVVFLNLGVLAFTEASVADEKMCYEYYLNHNGYILDKCETYKDKWVK